MGRKGITYEQVAAAADALLGDGQEPSIRTVRVQLGDTGSANTIHRHLGTWNESRPVSVAPPAPSLPQPLVSAIAVEIERAAAQARAEVETRLVAALTEGKELAAAGEAVEAERVQCLQAFGIRAGAHQALGNIVRHMRAARRNGVAINHMSALEHGERRHTRPHVDDGAAQIHFVFDEAGKACRIRR